MLILSHFKSFPTNDFTLIGKIIVFSNSYMLDLPAGAARIRITSVFNHHTQTFMRRSFFSAALRYALIAFCGVADKY